MNVGNLNCIFPARLYPSGQSFRPGVPRIDAILYNWSISDVPKIEVLDILMKIINILLLFYHLSFKLLSWFESIVFLQFKNTVQKTIHKLQ